MSSSLPGARPSAVDSRRRRALARLFRGVAASATLGVLGACGGGGGGGGSVPAPPPAPPSPSSSPAGPIAAQLSVPAPVGYDADRLAAFNRLNEIRLAAGLGMLAQDAALDQAAQAHAAWIVANDSFTHDETAGTPGFTGVHWWDRDEALGYVPVEGEELMAAPVRGASGVDDLVNAVYHRVGMLAIEPVDVGIGWSGLAAVNVAMPLVIDITKPGTDPVRGQGQMAQASFQGAVAWPLDGARDVPIRLGLESPNPIPGQDVLSLGTPVSISVGTDQAIAVDSFVITDVATGVAVKSQLLSSVNDPNSLVPASFVALVPLGILQMNTSYRVVFSGSATAFPSGAVERVVRTWIFSTGAR